jgi:hypothetical protein
MAENSLSPRAMREVAEMDWDDQESVKKLEETARGVFDALMVGHADTEENKTRARNYAVGALVSAFPRNKRDEVRSRIERVVVQATGGEEKRTKERTRAVKSNGKKGG